MVSAAAAAGMKRSVGLDHIRIAHRKGKVIQLDLLLDSHQSLLWKWLDSPGLAAVWIAPPRGRQAGASALLNLDRPVLRHYTVWNICREARPCPARRGKSCESEPPLRPYC